MSKALAELGENERAAFILRAVAELPCADVATILEVHRLLGGDPRPRSKR